MDFNFDPAKRTKPIPGGGNQSEYRSVMRKIMEGLTRDNLDTLLFLCKDHIPPSRDIQNNLDFLKYLEDRDLVSHHSAVFIAEALHIIRRMDLLKLIPCIRNKKHFEDEFLAFAYSSFSSYRVLTVQLQEELSQRDFESFRHECSQHLNNRSIDSAKNVLALLRNLEEQDVIDGEDFRQLIEILKNIDNVKPLKMFRRLLDGDESVVLPKCKQQQHRQNSEQNMFPDRRSQPPPTSDPPSYNSIGRVEAMPYYLRPGLRASISTPSGYDHQKKKVAPTDEPARFNFDNPDGTIKVDSRWFSPDEVTPKRLVASSAYPEHRRTESHQSLPPEYSPYSPHPRSQSFGDFSSLPPNPQYHPSMQHVASYPQMQGMQDQGNGAEKRPMYHHQGYTSPPQQYFDSHTSTPHSHHPCVFPQQSQFDPRISPPQSHYDPHTSPPQNHDPHVFPQQSQFDPRISPPQSRHDLQFYPSQPHYRHDTPSQSYLPFASRPTSQQHDPQRKYCNPSTSTDRVSPEQPSPHIPQTERDHEHDFDSSHVPPARLAPLEEEIGTLAVSDPGKTEGVAVEKLLRDSHDNTDIEKHGSDPEPEVQEKEDSRRQYEEIKAQNSRQQNDVYYKMDSSPVGICILINNVNFEANRRVDEYIRRVKLKQESEGKEEPLPNLELADRVGSDKDADKLEMLFERLDFDVCRHNDLDHRRMLWVLNEAKDTDHTNYDCFMLIILSHGEQGYVYGVDGFKLPVSDIQAKFCADKCKTLANKPKIIILQACQGVKTMPVAYAPVADIESDGPVDDNKDNGTPNKADFLLAYSTVPGYISYRSTLQGSYFVQEIIRIFKRCHKEEDLLSMMVMVSHEVGKYARKQVPMPIPTLRKKVYFHLKEGCSLDDLDDSRVTEYLSIEPHEAERVMQESHREH